MRCHTFLRFTTHQPTGLVQNLVYQVVHCLVTDRITSGVVHVRAAATGDNLGTPAGHETPQGPPALVRGPRL